MRVQKKLSRMSAMITDKASADISEAGPVRKKKDGSLTIAIQAKPGAKQNCITGVTADTVSVKIAAPAVEGAANTELVRYLASILNVRKSDVTLDRGSKSRIKTVCITAGNTISLEDVLSRLKSESSNS